MVARPLDIVTVCPAFSGNPLTSPVPAAPTIAARLRYPSTDKSTKQWSTLSELATTLIHPFFWGVKDVVPIFMSVTVPPIVGAKLLLLRLYPFINIHYYFQRCSNLVSKLGTGSFSFTRCQKIIFFVHEDLQGITLEFVFGDEWSRLLTFSNDSITYTSRNRKTGTDSTIWTK